MANQSREVNCLGWCGKTFKSEDPACIRFCPKCRAIRDNHNYSKRDQRVSKLNNDIIILGPDKENDFL